MCLSFCNKFFFIYLIIYSKLEHEQLLNPSSDFDIFCLHFVAMQLVTDAVDGFARGWNAHPISTENNFSPNHLFVLGLLQLKNSGFMHEELNQSNVVNKMAEREECNSSPLSEEKLNYLQANFNPSLITLNNVKENYLAVKAFVYALLFVDV